MNKFERANNKLNNSQSKLFDQEIIINGLYVVGSIDRYTNIFDGVAVEVIEVEILRSQAPINLTIGASVDIGDMPRTVRSIGGDEDHLLLVLDI